MTDAEQLRTLETLLEVFDNLAADAGRSPDEFPARAEAQKMVEELYQREHSS